MVPLSEGRSLHRVEFCVGVVERAKRISKKLARDPEWRLCFDSEEPSAVREAIVGSTKTASLVKDAMQLMDNLRKFGGQNDTDPLLVLVLDEAASLLTLP